MIFLFRQLPFFSGGAVFQEFFNIYLNEEAFDGALISCFPEMFFYITYGLLLTLFTHRRHTFFKRFPDFFYFILMDYAANFVELLFRSNVSAFHISTQTSILLIAVIRSCIIWLFLSLLQYHLVLLKQEHAERYQKLMLLISKLNGEVIWMKKNTELIENTMNTSFYRLFHELKRMEAE